MAPASEVYLHEMPGGQFTNLKAQARSMGLEERWHEVAEMYAEVNRMFGDIVKVTPSLQGRRRHGADDGGAGADPRRRSRTRRVEVAFPESVVDMMRGNLGQPPGGWPEALQQQGAEGRERR